jgi:hypothetical protein
MPSFEIDLVFTYRVSPRNVVLQVIHDAFVSIAAAAGKDLVITSREHSRETGGYVEIQFVYEHMRIFPNGGFQGIPSGVQMMRRPDTSIGLTSHAQVLRNARLTLGNEGGSVFVHAILELRVGGGPRYSRRTTYHPYSVRPETDFVSCTRPLFIPGERAFARCAGNVAVHEIAHQLGIHEHSRDPRNFMATGQAIGGLMYYNRREHLRRFWSGTKNFSTSQRVLLIESIRVGGHAGGFVTE